MAKYVMQPEDITVDILSCISTDILQYSTVDITVDITVLKVYSIFVPQTCSTFRAFSVGL